VRQAVSQPIDTYSWLADLSTDLCANDTASNKPKAWARFADTHIFFLIGITAWARNFPRAYAVNADIQLSHVRRIRT
jgi:hypothetical protein